MDVHFQEAGPRLQAGNSSANFRFVITSTFSEKLKSAVVAVGNNLVQLGDARRTGITGYDNSAVTRWRIELEVAERPSLVPLRVKRQLAGGRFASGFPVGAVHIITAHKNGERSLTGSSTCRGTLNKDDDAGRFATDFRWHSARRSIRQIIRLAVAI